jgi:transaldolase
MPLATLESVVRRETAVPTTLWPDPAGELKALADAGIDLAAVMAQLETDGVDAFADAWSALGDTIAQRLAARRS